MASYEQTNVADSIDNQDLLQGLIFLSILCGLVIGIRAIIIAPEWNDIIEHAQVLSGVVIYPSQHPSATYYLNAYSFLNHLATFFIKLNLSPYFINDFLKCLSAVVFYLGLSLCTFSLSRNVGWSLYTPIFLHLSGVTHFVDAYPISLFDNLSNVSNGGFGLFFSLLIIGLIACKQWHFGSFLLGMAPYVHLSYGVFLWGIAGILIMFWRREIKWRYTLFIPFLLGGGLFALSCMLQYGSVCNPRTFHARSYFDVPCLNHTIQLCQSTEKHRCIWR